MTALDEIDLDSLGPDELDALELGVIQVDARGLVTFYNQAESRFSGRRVEDVVGRNFFRDIAPCAHLPAFYGRFLECVRRPTCDERLTYTFSFRPKPVRVDVRIRSSCKPGRYWITVRPVEWVEPARSHGAIEVVDRRARAQDIDLDVCAREPIHVPGAIQPHASLLVVRPDDWRVTGCSENIAEALGRDPAAVLGRPLGALLPTMVAEAIARARRDGGLAVTTGEPFQLLAALLGRDHLVSAHEHHGRVLVELEVMPADGDFSVPSRNAIRNAVARVRRAASVGAATTVAAEEGRRLTGFERVVVYRFDAEWNGDAVAECLEDGAYPSLLGLRFPASDIPAQARALYLTAPPRFVIDRDYAPVGLLADTNDMPPVDLSFVAARSLSPIHLEYQRNLGVNGSMSVSVVVGGRLWGLLIGHHRRPHYTAPETRAAVATLVEALSLRIESIETEVLADQRSAHLAVQTALLDQLAGADNLAEALLDGPVTLLDLFDAPGAAIVEDHDVALIGATPTHEQVLELADHLLSIDAAQRTFATHRLELAHPPAAAYRETASGVLAAFAGPDRRRMLLWFKPEVLKTVAWGGDPNKAVVEQDGTARVLPRRSFERWVEQKRGSSKRWPEWQRPIAQALAEALEGVVWRQNRRIAELNVKQEELVAALLDKERLLELKEVLTREIDHRVKNSLSIVGAFLHMQARAADDEKTRAAFEETYARVMSVARVHDSLYQAESVEEVDLGQTIEALCRDLAEVGGPRRTIEVAAEPGLMVPYKKAVGLSLIAAELATNAMKYAYKADEAGVVSVDVRRQGGGACLTVADQGRGLPEEQETAPQGTGFGMKLVQAMLRQIGGEMQVESEGGARFTVCA